MGIRESINNNSTLVTSIAAVAMVAALLVLWQSMTPSSAEVRNIYYFDLDRGVVFTGPPQGIPPIETPSGGSDGVRVGIYSCGECDANFDGMTPEEVEQNDAFVAYYERYTEEAKSLLESGAAQNMDAEDPDAQIDAATYDRIAEAEVMGQVVRLPDSTEWVARQSAPGVRITEENPSERCGGDFLPRYCLP